VQEIVDVTLRSIGHDEAGLLSNLLELYIHDLSDVFPGIEVGPDGRFGYPKLAAYWSDPGRKSAFLITAGARIAGFALVTRGSPASDDPDVLDVAEFFVLRKYRRAAVGARAAHLLFRRFPGSFTVRALDRNPGAVAFWRRVVTDFTNGAAIETVRPGPPSAWRVFSFTTV
jgi:predicted acetyltransferase